MSRKIFFSFCLMIFKKLSNTWASTSSLALLVESKLNSSMQISGYIISPWVRFSSKSLGLLNAMKPSASGFMSTPGRGKKRLFSLPKHWLGVSNLVRHSEVYRGENAIYKMFTKSFPTTCLFIMANILSNQVLWILWRWMSSLQSNFDLQQNYKYYQQQVSNLFFLPLYAYTHISFQSGAVS